MHSPPLESALGSHRQKTCNSDRPFRSLALDVLFRLVEDVLGTRVQVRSLRIIAFDGIRAKGLPSRALNGALNGNIGVIKSMLAELIDHSNLALAFSYQPIAWSTGATLG